MNSEHLAEHLPFMKAMRQSGLKMLILIVNRTDGDKTVKALRAMHFHIQLTCMAKGTQGSEILAMLGLGSVDRTIVLCISPDNHIQAALPELVETLHLRKPGKGIAFSVPLFGVKLPRSAAVGRQLNEQWLSNMESEMDIMNDNITHSIVLAVINHGYSEELVKVAKDAGATGGTVVNARHAGAEDAVKFFGIYVQVEKEIVAILTKKETKQSIMDAINDAFGPSSPAKGIVLSLPVDQVAGMIDHA